MEMYWWKTGTMGDE